MVFNRKISVIHDKGNEEILEAGRRILNGEYIKDLTKIINGANSSSNSTNLSSNTGGYLPSDLIISFVLGIENKINKALLEGKNKEVDELKLEYKKMFSSNTREYVLDLVSNIINKKK